MRSSTPRWVIRCCDPESNIIETRPFEGDEDVEVAVLDEDLIRWLLFIALLFTIGDEEPESALALRDVGRMVE